MATAPSTTASSTLSGTLVPSPLLRLALRLDAAGSGAAGLLLAAAAGPLAAPTGLPEVLLRGCGLFFVGYAAFVCWLGTRQRPAAALVTLVAAGNAIWGIESLLAPALGWLSPTGAGLALIVAQAAFVFVMAALQATGLRRSIPGATA
ncbi:hypothetical protein [Alsobacter sp. R-9]